MMDKRLLALVPQAMRHVILTVVWQMMGLIGNVAFVWSIARVLSSLLQQQPIATAPIMCIMACGIAMRAASAKLASNSSFAASRDVRQVLRRRIYEKLLVLGPHYADSIPTAEVVQLSVEGTEQLETYFGQYLPQLFYSVFAPVTLFFIVAPISLPAAITLLVCVPLIPMVIIIVQKIAKRILAKYWDQYAELGDSFLENLQGLTTLKIYQADEARHKLMNREAEHFRKVTMAVLSMQLNSIIVMDIVALGGAAAGIAVALSGVAKGSVSIFGGIFIALVSADFFVPMRQLGSYFHVAMNGMAAADKIFRLLELPEPAQRTQTASPTDALAMRHTSFSYDGSRTVLNDVSLEVAPVGITGIVGTSGSGKSTIAALLTGRESEYTGDVLVGTKQIRDIDPKSMARHVTYLSDKSYLFAGTVRDNLLLANPDATDEQLWLALDAARLTGFLKGQEGLDTKLEDHAANLSGGQRQRLALARALLADSPIYILDEATSNIDVESEEYVMAAVHQLARDHAVVVISHRLANVTRAQRIYVMEQGELVGAGTHEELLDACPAYRSLWNQQLELERYGREARHEAE